MKYCFKCGAKVKDDALYCQKCGVKLNVNKENSQSEKQDTITDFDAIKLNQENLSHAEQIPKEEFLNENKEDEFYSDEDSKSYTKGFNQKNIIVAIVITLVVLSAVIIGLFKTAIIAPIIYNVQVSEDQVNVMEGNTKAIQTKFCIFPESRRNSCFLNYKSKNEDIAFVNSNGNIEGISKGKAEVDVSINNKIYKKVMVDVKPIKVMNLEVDALKAKYNQGESFKLNISFDILKSSKQPNVKYSSSNTSVITVDKSGYVQTVNPGQALLVVKVGDQSRDFKIKVVKDPMIDINKTIDKYRYVDFIAPNSDTQYLTQDFLKTLSKLDLSVARNEIFARHGYAFTSDLYRNYFESKAWYYKDPYCNENSAEDMLNEVEKYNINLIKKFENK